VHHQNGDETSYVRLSARFKRAIFDLRFRGVRQSEIAIQAGFHPTAVSKLLHDAVPVRAGDPRVVRLGAALGIPAEECFEQIDRGEIEPVRDGPSATIGAA